MAGVTQRDYYEVLGVPREADAKTIRDAFRKLALQYHPDRNKEPDAEERFKEIAEAYGILSDPDKRAKYDAGGFGGVAGFSTEDIFGGIDLGDIFGDLGHGFGGSIFDRLFRHGGAPAGRGRDLEVLLTVPLATIATGGKETVRFDRPATCDACTGSGARTGTTPKTCDECGGSGQKTIRQGREEGVQFRQITTCPRCQGQGQVIEDPCPQCHGSGRINKAESLQVTVPAGAEEGLALRIPGHGFPGVGAAAAGDLFVIVRSEPDARFQRLGADLWRHERLEVADAVLGVRRQVPTLNGEVEVRIPEGTQPDEVLRLRGKGLPIGGTGARGDLNIRIEVHIPEHPTAEERALYEQLRALADSPRRHWHWREKSG
jgi:molecular chaperone DnaJ